MKVGFGENKNPLVGAHLGPIWGGTLGALGPIWGGSSGRPKADIMEAEGRLNGGLGAEPLGIKKYILFFGLSDHCQVLLKASQPEEHRLGSLD